MGWGRGVGCGGRVPTFNKETREESELLFGIVIVSASTQKCRQPNLKVPLLFKSLARIQGSLHSTYNLEYPYSRY